MHFVKNVKYVSGFKLMVSFEDGKTRLVDLENYLDGEIFEPLKDLHVFSDRLCEPGIRNHCVGQRSGYIS